jgi:prepilin-type N-terminal cleavage/methylation domain-containing protein
VPSARLRARAQLCLVTAQQGYAQLQSMKQRRGFTLMELIVVVLVIGVLGSIAVIGTSAVIGRSSDSKSTLRMQDLLTSAQAMYNARHQVELTYTFEQAFIDVAGDLPVYTSGALSEGTLAADTTVNGWRIQTDTGPDAYSSAANHIMVLESSEKLYVASIVSSTRAVFGSIGLSGHPRVWLGACSTTSCDSATALAGQTTR